MVALQDKFVVVVLDFFLKKSFNFIDKGLGFLN